MTIDFERRFFFNKNDDTVEKKTRENDAFSTATLNVYSNFLIANDIWHTFQILKEKNEGWLVTFFSNEHKSSFSRNFFFRQKKNLPNNWASIAVLKPQGPAPITKTLWPAHALPFIYTLCEALLSNLAHKALAFQEVNFDLNLG